MSNNKIGILSVGDKSFNIFYDENPTLNVEESELMSIKFNSHDNVEITDEGFAFLKSDNNYFKLFAPKIEGELIKFERAELIF